MNTCRSNRDGLQLYDVCEHCVVDADNQTALTDICLVCNLTNTIGTSIKQYISHTLYNSLVINNILNECSLIAPTSLYVRDTNNYTNAPVGSSFYNKCFDNCNTCTTPINFTTTNPSSYHFMSQCLTDFTDGTNPNSIYDMGYKWTTPVETAKFATMSNFIFITKLI